MSETKRKKIFGTDGVRGKANIYPMTPDILMRLAIAAGKHFTRGDHRHMVVIGKDTRLSGYMIEPALVAGFISVGMDVMLVGPMPTPAIAMLTGSLRADMGVMISASHNPYQDNGIKFFGPDGLKLSDEVERLIEQEVLSGSLTGLANPEDLGRARRLEDAPGRYIEFVKSICPKHVRLDGLKIVIDCANGAAYHVAPPVFWELGAEIIPIAVSPNGCNINKECGATDIELMRRTVLEHGADIGISLDGDADRVVMVDEKGRVIDGDNILALIAKSWQAAGYLSGDGVVGTVMSNMGLEAYLQELGLKLYRTPVGDRYVSALMREKNLNVGGEQSGHIILTDYSTSGDGLIAALQVLAVIVESGKPASQVCDLFEPYPQVLRNVDLKGSNPLDNPDFQNYLQQVEKDLAGKARILVRKSGTEPLLRIMAEGQNRQLLDDVIDGIIKKIA
ncbi:MAG: phosphoglucosamine mutase [Alphaproteobacteria bacterium]|nr:phosphoglucosamine mutase [Alphaproteobacteria bacterium]